jgi:hypothetical protein
MQLTATLSVSLRVVASDVGNSGGGELALGYVMVTWHRVFVVVLLVNYSCEVPISLFNDIVVCAMIWSGRCERLRVW